MSEVLIKQLHNTPYRIVLYVAGCGSTALQQFTLYPGSSKFALESANFYAQGSLQELVGHKITKYVTAEVAEDMALKALLKSHDILRSQEDLNSQDFLYTVGIGMTGAIASTTPRQGKHHTYICYNFGSRKYTYYINLEKGFRSRIEEDEYISQKLFEILIHHCQQNQGTFNQIFHKQHDGNQSQIIIQPNHCQIDCVTEDNNICLFDLLISQGDYLHSILLSQHNYQLNPKLEKSVILSGSFNPIHQGHVELAYSSAQRLDYQNVYFELSIVNADKGAIKQDEVWKRILLMRERNLQIIISNRPLFKDKNVFLENGAFAIGVDTYTRLIDTKYYHSSVTERDISFVKFLQHNNKIIVAPRFNENTQKVEQLPDFEVPPLIAKHVIEVKGFRNDISSTQIRKKDNIRAQSTPH